MIKERTPLTLYEARELLESLKDSDRKKEIVEFISKFEKIDVKKAKKIKEEIEALDIIKLKNSDIIKIVDVMPENAIELNKVVMEASLDSDETNKIIETIKKNK